MNKQVATIETCGHYLTYTAFNQEILSISGNSNIWRQHFLDDLSHGSCYKSYIALLLPSNNMSNRKFCKFHEQQIDQENTRKVKYTDNTTP